MVDISVAFKEYHGDRFQSSELARMKKACFFAGLRENYKYLVSHLKDQDDVDPIFMLKEIRECDESQYLVSTSNCPKGSGDGSNKNTGYYDKKNYDRRGYGSYQARSANVWEDPEDYQSDSLSEVKSEKENDDVQQDKSYHVGVTMTADEGEAFFGKCYNCGELGHPWCSCKKPQKPVLKLALNSEIERKAQLMEKKAVKAVKPEWGHRSEERPRPKGPSGSSSELRAPCDTPFSYWNEDTRDWWLGLENIGQTLTDGEPVITLINNGARVNTVTSSFVKRHGLKVGSINDLNKHRGRIPVSCSGGYYTEPIGYVLVRVQFPGIPSYDENQVALVIRDGSEFRQRVLVIIGTPTIDQVVRALKESEMDTIPEEWQRARCAHEYINGFFVRSMNLMRESRNPISK